MVFAKKSLGQNFLQSTEVRKKIINSAGEITGKNVLEIGPGLGFLTTKLLAANANVTAVELDERAIEILNRDFAHKPNFHLISGSILDLDLDEIWGTKNYCVIANIPYHITSPILKRLLAETKNQPEFALLMVQKEVAQKLCDKKNSILKTSVDVFAESEICFEVPRENFQPIPKVDSAVIKLNIRDVPLVKKEMQKDFFTVVNAGFSQKRKKLGNFLGSSFGIPAEQLLGDIDPHRRAETLEITEWIAITERFQGI